MESAGASHRCGLELTFRFVHERELEAAVAMIRALHPRDADVRPLHLGVVDADAGQSLFDVALEQHELFGEPVGGEDDVQRGSESEVDRALRVRCDENGVEVLDFPGACELGELLGEQLPDLVGVTGCQAADGNVEFDGEGTGLVDVHDDSFLLRKAVYIIPH